MRVYALEEHGFGLGLIVVFVDIHIDDVVRGVHTTAPAWSMAETPLELLPRVVGMLEVLLCVGSVLCSVRAPLVVCMATADSCCVPGIQ